MSSSVPSKPSLPRQPDDARSFEFTCAQCGGRYLAKSGGCPTCRSSSAHRGEEITKKVMDDDNDLIK
jgi:hypothetical protein